MCGLVGYTGSFEINALMSGMRAISHRGPDDSGIYVNSQNSVALGHVRLSIQDVSPLGHQPMQSDDGQVVLVFNGEIYNFKELRTELEIKGYRFKGHSDTEVVLNLYLEYGEDILRRLNGIFSFAFWDGRRRATFLARDALGVKPLYYSIVKEGVAFASELKALIPLIPQMRELDYHAIKRYLTFLWCPGEGTPLKSVRKLAPGEAMWLVNGNIQRRWHWYVLPVTQYNTGSSLNYKDSVNGTLDSLRTAVHRQMVADVPVGAFLSGGLDSSAVVAFARECNPRIQCFTIDIVGGVDAGETSDLPYAREVASHLKVPLEVVSIDSSQMADGFVKMVEQLDEPLADPSPLNVFFISKLARDQGIKVLLSGAGGDDLFTGYRRHLAVHFQRYWDWVPAGLRGLGERVFTGLDQRNPKLRRITKFLAGAGLSGDDRLVSYFAWGNKKVLDSLLSSEFRNQIQNERAEQPMLEFLNSLPHTQPSLIKMLALEQRFFLSDHNLMYTDKMSMAAGVETRVPFLDLELVEFVSHIPMKYLQNGNVGKWILKKVMEPFLPKHVIYRPKTGFGAPIRRWLKTDLRDLLEDTLSIESLKKRGLFDSKSVKRLIEQDRKGEIDGAYTLLSIMCVEIWCRKYLDEQINPLCIDSHETNITVA